MLNITVSAAERGGGWRTGVADGPRGNGPSASTPFPILPSEDSLHVRVLVDRSSAEFFVGRGRSTRTMRAYPAAGDSGASVVAGHAGAMATVEAFEMACGWEGEEA